MPVLLACSVVLLLAGCNAAARGWQHPVIPPAHWLVDAAWCRHDSLRRAERRLTARREIPASTSAHDDTLDALMHRSRVIRTARRHFFASCMTQLGYVPVGEPPDG